LSDRDFGILFESISTPLAKQDISVSFSNRKYEAPNYLEKEIKRRIESMKKLSKEKGFKFFDDRVARLDNWSFNKNSNDQRLMLKLYFSETSYYYFGAMNLGLDEPVIEIADKNNRSCDKNSQFTLRELFDEKYFDLKGSILPNPLSVNMSVVLISSSSKSGYKPNLKPKIILSKRSKSHTLEACGTLSCIIGGTISIGEGDKDAAGNPDPFRTVIREAKEELGLELDDDESDNNNIIFFGLGRNMSNLKPELYGEVLISGVTEKEVVQSWKNAKDREESNDLIFEDLEESRIRSMIKQNNLWSPVGRTATSASLRNSSRRCR
jgi:8-oxo-dGTP pyrophosphatase MutT (NUDIX family)